MAYRKSGTEPLRSKTKFHTSGDGKAPDMSGKDVGGRQQRNGPVHVKEGPAWKTPSGSDQNRATKFRDRSV